MKKILTLIFLSVIYLDPFDGYTLITPFDIVIQDDVGGPGSYASILIDNDENIINRRALTNIGTFRAYICAYLRNNANIHKDMTFLVRQLTPSSNGIPIEIYVFSNDTDWINYESIQADIFDHLLAAIKEFDLRIFQNPTGNDFKRISN